ncbi:unnamed protein product [Lactuca virosa]|uniref:Uncharacterized protein n=1 Tax=Lactuca virosa TaxID=75947 RepID=A0AAU9PC44_9ASTR|nr:unnamed protein product [Lactuca virosa]
MFSTFHILPNRPVVIFLPRLNPFLLQCSFFLAPPLLTIPFVIGGAKTNRRGKRRNRQGRRRPVVASRLSSTACNNPPPFIVYPKGQAKSTHNLKSIGSITVGKEDCQPPSPQLSNTQIQNFNEGLISLFSYIRCYFGGSCFASFLNPDTLTRCKKISYGIWLAGVLVTGYNFKAKSTKKKQPVLEKGIVDLSILHKALVEYLTVADKG